jgi:heterodisulfide reductase subunit A-like polyferredoxin
MSLYNQRFNPRCGICQKAGRPYNAIEELRRAAVGVWVRCRTCGHESYRRSWAARHRALRQEVAP